MRLRSREVLRGIGDHPRLIALDLHSMVAGSELIDLHSNDHILQAHEPAFADLIARSERFVNA